MTSLQKRLLSAAVLAPLVGVILWHGGWPFAALTCGVAALALWEWVALARKARRPWFFGAFGAVYIPLAAWGFLTLGPTTALVLALAIYAGDAAAYFAGRAIGGPKLWPALSPRKTWAGLAAAPVPAMCIAGVWYGVPWIALGLGIGLLGQAGDLLISALKRAAGVKDSGDLIPGHGGVLDRIDSLLLPCTLYGVWALAW